jgi:hypothetical protein
MQMPIKFGAGSSTMLCGEPIHISIHVASYVGRLSGLVVRVRGYRSRGPGFHSRAYKII